MTRRKMTAEEQEAAREQFLIATSGMLEQSQERLRLLKEKNAEIKKHILESTDYGLKE